MTALERDTAFGRDYQITYYYTDRLRYALERLDHTDRLRPHRSCTPNPLPFTYIHIHSYTTQRERPTYSQRDRSDRGFTYNLTDNLKKAIDDAAKAAQTR